MLPADFRPSRALTRLSVAAVGLTMAALTGGALAFLASDAAYFGQLGATIALPTLVAGTAWAALLRWRRTELRLGWLLSLPLAGLGAALVGLLTTIRTGTTAPWWKLPYAILTDGAFVWVPTMLVVLLVFGPPIAWSQRQARRGLLGAERGEAGVGAFCALLSLGVLLALLARGRMPWSPLSYDPEVLADRGLLEPLTSHLAAEVRAKACLALLPLLGALSGASVVALAASRARRRRQLIAAAESGARPDYRVERTPAGRVLVRVRVADTDYRQADADEESFALEGSLRAAIDHDLSSRSPGSVLTPGP